MTNVPVVTPKNLSDAVEQTMTATKEYIDRHAESGKSDDTMHDCEPIDIEKINQLLQQNRFPIIEP